MNSTTVSSAFMIKLVAGCIAALVVAFLYLIMPPSAFPAGSSFVVSESETLASVSERLERGGYIRSAFLFRAWMSFLGEDTTLQLGMYEFAETLPLPGIVKKFAADTPDAPLASVTIPEGSTTDEVAALFRKTLPDFDVRAFKEKVRASDAEGRLFPSTYHLLPSMTEEKAVELMTDTFERKYAEAFADASLPAPLLARAELISLAAILEGEAKTEEDMRIVAGILLKRLKMGMRLQVDVAMETYAQGGLPKTPINNPGLMSLDAAMHPEESPYLYYITGRDGIMHYSKTFEEHKRNIKNYLK